MTFCNDHGLPHSEFLDWDTDDRQKALAWMVESPQFCRLCGTAEWEWEENPYAYVVQSSFCKGCYNKEAASEDAGKMQGTTVILAPNTEAVRAKQREHQRLLSELDVEDQPAVDPLQND